MQLNPQTLPYRAVGEWTLTGAHSYGNPFTAVRITGTFTSPSGDSVSVPGFYDGDNTWRVRFSPHETGEWTVHLYAYPANPDLELTTTLTVTPSDARGFLTMTGDAWGLGYETGDPAFVVGDTVYNLFGAAHCGMDVKTFMQRRADQGFDMLRVRLQVSPFHGPEGYSHWQTRSTWAWGGSPQSPKLDEFNLEWFHTVDQVVQWAENLGLGLEMIMQAWGFEYPFNDRGIFTAEWEELWMQYLIARYDAFSSVFAWTLMNEYEYYPDGRCYHNATADRWALRMGRYVKSLAGHGHIVAIHNGPQMPPFAERFAADPDAVDMIMFQDWGAMDEQHGWLATGITESIHRSMAGWLGACIFSEYGYERAPDVPPTFPFFDHTGPEHNRRGAWRGLMAAVGGVVTGFDYTWGPEMILDRDQAGISYLMHLKRFVTEVITFADYQSAPDVIATQDYPAGYVPLALATPAHDRVVVYLPAGGSVTLNPTVPLNAGAQWFDPRTGALNAATHSAEGLTFTVPEVGDDPDRPWDWVLILGS